MIAGGGSDTDSFIQEIQKMAADDPGLSLPVWSADKCSMNYTATHISIVCPATWKESESPEARVMEIAVW